ncbi:hypothetical protein LCGC14_0808080 [marine sediment metagenome]|uniref:Uncharacterized protein n=1 Tax=marine sediment metagenome TaxID=412755 RepID=A0A0F9Q7M8_9ZZZZ
MDGSKMPENHNLGSEVARESHLSYIIKEVKKVEKSGPHGLYVSDYQCSTGNNVLRGWNQACTYILKRLKEIKSEIKS